MRRIHVLLMIVGLSAAMAVPGHAETVTSMLSGGLLAVTTSPTTMSSTTLSGSNQTATGTSTTPWSLVDARGTGAAWTVTISGTNFTSVAGTVDTTQRSFGVGNLAVTAGTITAGVGSDPITNITSPSSITLSTTAQTLVSSIGTNKGTYTFSPTFTLTIPANAYRANYAGMLNSSALSAYTSTITVTIA